MSLLTLVQRFCLVNGMTQPNIVVSSQDQTVLQYLGILNELLDEILQDSKYQAFTKEALWTCIAQEDQGAVTDLAPDGFLFFHNQTFFDRTLRRPLFGPVEDDEWQALKAIPNPGPFYKFRVRGDRFLINPVPAAPLSLIAFEYASSHGVRAAAGTTKQYFTADDDVPVLPEALMQRGLSYRWKQIKGLPYQADETAYRGQLNNIISNSKPRRVMSLGTGNDFNIRPGIWVPSGNWNV
jgi:hypothetical protein